MPNVFLIDTDRAEAIEHPLTLEALQATVGGYIEPAFTVASPSRPGYAVTGYVNDCGLIDGLPITCVMNGQPLAGPMLVCGLNTGDGDTVPLTDDEVQWIAGKLNLLFALGHGRQVHAIHELDLD